METVALGHETVGPGYAPYFIAEVGANHNGDMDLCHRLIDSAADAGVHAVKFQSWSESSLISREEYERNLDYADKEKHFGSLRDMVRAYQFTPEQHREAAIHCHSRGVAFASSAFSTPEVDLLEDLQVPFHKIASMDINNLSLIAYVASKQRPVLISTGMATLGEVEQAVGVVREQGNEQAILLHCVSIYPPPRTGIHLANMAMLRAAFDVPVGFSDHTLGTPVPLAAIALGACVIEKHFTLDKAMAGWDHAISADPDEMRRLVDDGLVIQQALGNTARSVSDAEMNKRHQFRRSLVARRSLPKGHALGKDDLAAKRPGTGIAPDEVRYVLGRRLAREVAIDDVIRWSDLV